LTSNIFGRGFDSRRLHQNLPERTHGSKAARLNGVDFRRLFLLYFYCYSRWRSSPLTAVPILKPEQLMTPDKRIGLSRGHSAGMILKATIRGP